MIDSLSITNVLSGSSAVVLNDLNYPLSDWSTEIDVSRADRPKGSRHGNFTTPTYLNMRTIHIEGQILGNGATDALAYADYVAKRRALIKAVMPHNERFIDETCVLRARFTGMSEDVTIACTIDGYPDIPMSWDTGSRSPFQLNLKAFDPRFYGVTGQSAVLAHNVSQVIANAGEIEVYPSATIYGDSSGVTSRQLRWGSSSADYRSVTFGAIVSAGSNIAIDFKNLLVYDSSGVNRYGYLTAKDWWALEPGNNTVIYIGSGGTPSGTTVTLNWTNAYML